MRDELLNRACSWRLMMPRQDHGLAQRLQPATAAHSAKPAAILTNRSAYAAGLHRPQHAIVCATLTRSADRMLKPPPAPRRRKTPRGSNRLWMKVQWQVRTAPVARRGDRSAVGSEGDRFVSLAPRGLAIIYVNNMLNFTGSKIRVRPSLPGPEFYQNTRPSLPIHREAKSSAPTPRAPSP